MNPSDSNKLVDLIFTGYGIIGFFRPDTELLRGHPAISPKTLVQLEWIARQEAPVRLQAGIDERKAIAIQDILALAGMDCRLEPAGVSIWLHPLGLPMIDRRDDCRRKGPRSRRRRERVCDTAPDRRTASDRRA